MYLKLAAGNVRRSMRDYAVYFGTLCFAACLLYSFVASADYLLALDLTEDQRNIYARSGDVVRAFSVLTVVVFVFLIAYANRFLVRRRKREFGMYYLLGMRPVAVATVLALESGMVAACSLVAGVALGAALSPAFGFVAAFMFDVPWAFAFSFSLDAALWTAGSFAVIAVLAAGIAVRDLRRRTLAELMDAEHTPERLRLSGRAAGVVQALLGVAVLGVVWGSCLLYPMYFVVFVLPMGIAALAGTYLLFRAGICWATRHARRSRRYLRGLRPVVVRQIEGRAESGCAALACAGVLVAAALCMICAGLVFSVGMRAGLEEALGSAVSAGTASALAPIAYVGILYGGTFLVAAAAVLALQQLTGALDSRRSYEILDEMGTDERMLRRSVREQVGVCFALPAGMALVHCVFGFQLIGFLAEAFGSASFAAIAASATAFVIVVLAAYYAVCCRSCERMLIGVDVRSRAAA